MAFAVDVRFVSFERGNRKFFYRPQAAERSSFSAPH
jgi:hypothetical protein